MSNQTYEGIVTINSSPKTPFPEVNKGTHHFRRAISAEVDLQTAGIYVGCSSISFWEMILGP